MSNQPYNPQAQILVRDWVNAHHYDMASVLSYLGQHGVKVWDVENPYAPTLAHQHASFSPTARVIAKSSKRWLDSFAKMMGPVERNRSLHVTFHEQDDGTWAVPSDDAGINHADVNWWLFRPPTLVMDKPEMDVHANDFDWQPPIVLHPDTGTVFLYGLVDIMDGPTFINGVRCSSFTETSDSDRNDTPGGWRWGRFCTHVPLNKINQLLGQ